MCTGGALVGSVAGSVRGARGARLRWGVCAGQAADQAGSGSGNFKLKRTYLQGPTATEADLPALSEGTSESGCLPVSTVLPVGITENPSLSDASGSEVCSGRWRIGRARGSRSIIDGRLWMRGPLTRTRRMTPRRRSARARGQRGTRS